MKKEKKQTWQLVQEETDWKSLDKEALKFIWVEARRDQDKRVQAIQSISQKLCIFMSICIGLLTILISILHFPNSATGAALKIWELGLLVSFFIFCAGLFPMRFFGSGRTPWDILKGTSYKKGGRYLKEVMLITIEEETTSDMRRARWGSICLKIGMITLSLTVLGTVFFLFF